MALREPPDSASNTWPLTSMLLTSTFDCALTGLIEISGTVPGSRLRPVISMESHPRAFCGPLTGVLEVWKVPTDWPSTNTSNWPSLPWPPLPTLRVMVSTGAGASPSPPSPCTIVGSPRETESVGASAIASTVTARAAAPVVAVDVAPVTGLVSVTVELT